MQERFTSPANDLPGRFPPRSLGIEVIHQQPEMAEEQDISRNVFLGSELGWPKVTGRWIKIPNVRRMDEEAARILARLGMRYTSLRESAANLSGEQRQLIAIARTLTRPARLIVIDDPGVLLSYPYQQKLLALIQDWRQSGVAVLLASDNVDQLMTVTDRIIVLRHGHLIAERRTDETNREAILAAMVGEADQEQLTPIIWALDSYYRAREQAEKLHHQQRLLEHELGAPDALKQEIIDQLADQISALDRANLALQDAQRRLLTELELERKRLAREIHDGVIQDLLGVGYQLEEIEASAKATPALAEELQDVRGNVRDLVGDLRHICSTLRPPTIDSLGLGSALQSCVHEWSKRTGIGVTLNLDPNLGRLPEATELSIFRIVQEGLTNVRKHAAANTVEIGLAHTSPPAVDAVDRRRRPRPARGLRPGQHSRPRATMACWASPNGWRCWVDGAGSRTGRRAARSSRSKYLIPGWNWPIRMTDASHLTHALGDSPLVP